MSTYWLLTFFAYGVEANSRVLHLRPGLRTSLKQQPPGGVVAAAAPAAPQGNLADMFARMDTNKDGKIDCTELANAQHSGAFSLAPAPAPFAGSPSMASITAGGPAPVPAANQLPPHLLVPPSLPSKIPEPPPPPHAPPQEPGPPPQPPREGQLISSPPGEESLETSGNLAAMVVNDVLGADLDAADKETLQAPSKPAPLPSSILPPELPKVFRPFPSPRSLPPHLMTPAPVAFGVDMARTLPDVKKAPLSVVPMED